MGVRADIRDSSARASIAQIPNTNTMYNTIVVLLKCQMPIVYSTKYQSALQKSGVQNSSEDSIAQMPRQSNNINRLLLSAFRKGGWK